MVEHLRYLVPLLLRGEVRRSQWHLLGIWVIVSLYGIYRGFSWLFMYINEQWHQILVTQISLTAGDVVCYVWLFAGRPSTGMDIVRGIKCTHVCFSIFEMLFSRNSKGFLGDYGRNTAFILDDGLFLWLFLRDNIGIFNADSIAGDHDQAAEHGKRNIHVKTILATMILYGVAHNLVARMTEQDLI